jgi:DnaJ-class molecular chaperone
MDKTFDPEKYEMVFCPFCNGKGKFVKNPDGSDVCMRCGGFGLIKKEEVTEMEALA